MGAAISVRLDDEAEQALRTLEAAGLSRSDAIREALVHSADRLRRSSELAAEVAALDADEADRAEMVAVAGLMERVSAPVFLAGGIGPENVENALLQVRPHGIDLCSGVEASKGKKDPEKLRRLIENFEAAQAKLKGGNG